VIERDAQTTVYFGFGKVLFSSQSWSKWGWIGNGWVEVRYEPLDDEEVGKCIVAGWSESKSRDSLPLPLDGLKKILEVAEVRSERELGKRFPVSTSFERKGEVVLITPWEADRNGGFGGSSDDVLLDDLSPRALGRAARLTR
jgi:hypothetical protein